MRLSELRDVFADAGIAVAGIAAGRAGATGEGGCSEAASGMGAGLGA